ncbi:MAG: DUF2975 domain-containing protein [Propionibacteriaceae bacterium]|jgi:hypothetical protein|nr:DUF2975 domain-containing protein [Propionibacteriaceae bacterium]
MSERPLWNAQRSATLSIVVTWIALGLAVACVPLLVPILNLVYNPAWVVRAAGPLYAGLVFGIAALVLLLRVLIDIRRGEVFTVKNVWRLRALSYCGYAIMLACVVGFIVQPEAGFVLLALIAGFMGLLMRVIKNVIDTARLLKEDADYTI